jgi:hypothetical protein
VVAFGVGQVVSVDARTEPGFNKLGGIARIMVVNTIPSLTYNIKYVLGGSEKGIAACYVHLHDATKQQSPKRQQPPATVTKEAAVEQEFAIPAEEDVPWRIELRPVTEARKLRRLQTDERRKAHTSALLTGVEGDMLNFTVSPRSICGWARYLLSVPVKKNERTDMTPLSDVQAHSKREAILAKRKTSARISSSLLALPARLMPTPLLSGASAAAAVAEKTKPRKELTQLETGLVAAALATGRDRGDDGNDGASGECIDDEAYVDYGSANGWCTSDPLEMRHADAVEVFDEQSVRFRRAFESSHELRAMWRTSISELKHAVHGAGYAGAGTGDYGPPLSSESSTSTSIVSMVTGAAVHRGFTAATAALAAGGDSGGNSDGTGSAGLDLIGDVEKTIAEADDGKAVVTVTNGTFRLMLEMHAANQALKGQLQQTESECQELASVVGVQDREASVVGVQDRGGAVAKNDSGDGEGESLGKRQRSSPRAEKKARKKKQSKGTKGSSDKAKARHSLMDALLVRMPSEYLNDDDNDDDDDDNDDDDDSSGGSSGGGRSSGGSSGTEKWRCGFSNPFKAAPDRISSTQACNPFTSNHDDSGEIFDQQTTRLQWALERSQELQAIWRSSISEIQRGRGEKAACGPNKPGEKRPDKQQQQQQRPENAAEATSQEGGSGLASGGGVEGSTSVGGSAEEGGGDGGVGNMRLALEVHAVNAALTVQMDHAESQCSRLKAAIEVLELEA